MARRLGRPKGGQALLTRDRILTTALRIVDDEGVAALSMRRLATELGVDPMAIYHHLSGKHALLVGLTEIVFQQLRLPPVDDTPWQEQVRTFARAYRSLTQTHPNLVLYLVTDAEARKNERVSMANELLYAALARAGLPPEMIVGAADLLVDYLNGFALGESSASTARASPRAELDIRLEEHYRPEQFPVMHRVLSSLSERDRAADIEAGLDIIVAGIEALARREL
jgi:TetR/AcrR family transcriptional regulator, tetracycline repressor protein